MPILTGVVSGLWPQTAACTCRALPSQPAAPGAAARVVADAACWVVHRRQQRALDTPHNRLCSSVPSGGPLTISFRGNSKWLSRSQNEEAVCCCHLTLMRVVPWQIVLIGLCKGAGCARACADLGPADTASANSTRLSRWRSLTCISSEAQKPSLPSLVMSITTGAAAGCGAATAGAACCCCCCCCRCCCCRCRC